MARLSLHKKYLNKLDEYNALAFESDCVDVVETQLKLKKINRGVELAWEKFVKDKGFDGY